MPDFVQALTAAEMPYSVSSGWATTHSTFSQPRQSRLLIWFSFEVMSSTLFVSAHAGAGLTFGEAGGGLDADDGALAERRNVGGAGVSERRPHA